MMKADLPNGIRVLVIANLILWVTVFLFIFMGASYRTPNFIVSTPDAQQAKEFGQRAETLRKDLAILWLGRPLPRDWSRPCPVTVQVGPGLGAGGATTFVFNEGEVFGWRMNIQGSRQRVLDTVLPHEITHMIFASHFRQPVPRWADEGAATSVEYVGEQVRHRRLLVQFLRNRRGIAFSRMFSMTEYPRDMMPLYAQGYTLCDFLIRLRGRRRLVNYIRDGLKAGRWDATTKQHYGHENLGELQNEWVAWVGRGFPVVRTVGYGNT